MYQAELHERETPSEQNTAQPDPGEYLLLGEHSNLGKYLFVLHPCSRDFYPLAQHNTAAPQETLHPALWPQRVQVAQRLRQIGEAIGEKEAEREEHQAAYHALRLLVW